MERTQRTFTRLFAITALVAAFALSYGQGGFGGPPQGGPDRGGPGQGGPGQGGPGQGGPGQQFRMPRGPQLLKNPDVQKELKLSDAQMKAIDQAFPQPGGGQGGRGGPGGPGMQGGPGGPGGQGGPGGPGGQGAQGGQRGGGQRNGGQGGQGGRGGQGGPNPQNDAKIKEILSPQQYTRFKQIEIQVVGPLGLMMPEVAERLQITEEQREDIREVLESMRPPEGGQGGQSQDPAKRMKEVMSKVLAVLSEKQRAEYRALVGKEFVLTTRPPMGGPGGPGGRQGGPGGPGGPPPPDATK